tara:strand:- start:1900 stop:2442 length:543 start_codon:yes stop_codon:yes gene_type:complete
MAKEVKMQPEVVEEKVQRVLGADIESATYVELSERFDAFVKELEEKTYGLSVTQESIALLTMKLLPSIEWKGQQAWDIIAVQKVIVDLKPNVVAQVSREAVRSLFQVVATNQYTGVDDVNQVSVLLTSLAEVIQEQIAVDENTLRDAGFELAAAEQGILPETAMQDAMDADVIEGNENKA